MTNVIIGTGNPHKRDAVREAFKEFFLEDLDIQMINVSSDVPKQPMDSEQIEQGAQNRIKNMKLMLGKDVEYIDYFVSVEAGIMQIGKNYFNVQYVIVEDVKQHVQKAGISPAYEVPSKYIDFIKRSSINNLFRRLFGDRGEEYDHLLTLSHGQIDRKGLIKCGTNMALTGFGLVMKNEENV